MLETGWCARLIRQVLAESLVVALAAGVVTGAGLRPEGRPGQCQQGQPQADGDLGTTLGKCAANVRGVLAAEPSDLGATLKGCAQACAKASGSTRTSSR